ncbi:MAG: hypothetical protein GXP59_02000, partial [Deltaproteobacteria bacterium]|nr:hypothetical protein [Deltaproteobacteria bacterium]
MIAVLLIVGILGAVAVEHFLDYTADVAG